MELTEEEKQSLARAMHNFTLVLNSYKKIISQLLVTMLTALFAGVLTIIVAFYTENNIIKGVSLIMTAALLYQLIDGCVLIYSILKERQQIKRSIEKVHQLQSYGKDS